MQKTDEKKQWTQKNLDKLKGIFPEAFIGNKLVVEKLLQLVGEETDLTNEKYEFNWYGKAEAIRLIEEPPTKIFQPNLEKSMNWESTNNLYIEGENLEVLRLLQQSHEGKIKMIYIDPPYNTGMEFIYNDNFRGRVNTFNDLQPIKHVSERLHSNWLNFMYPRLMLARKLLTEDGMIFISISDKELYNLKKICDEIFGEENFVSTFIWEKKKKPSFLDRNVGCVTEYILAFSKNNEKSQALSIEKTTIGKKYPINNAGNALRVLTFPEGSVKFSLSDGIVQKQEMSAGKIITELLDDVVIKNGRNQNAFRLKGEWRYSQERVDEIIRNGEEIVISKVPFRPNHVKKGGEVKKMKNLFSIPGYGFPTYEDADKQITELFGKKVFDYAKPEMLIRRLIQSLLYQDEEAIILDFFSGSATTGESVWRLNQEFHKNHRFILVQHPEEINQKTVAYQEGFRTISELGWERLKRSRERILQEGNPENQDIGFIFLELKDD
ncbi:site-specific DNA-methyltransferase [Oceanobacillus senegalensis]|uniref:site-specific DNA-methyltransferase n=1 Tax=Oceanobacillus senegalensis TaxID=1936063 RepID=UPI000A310FB2|nr:site-specific DNA-methyltransferase [Oceanobacillus senegalensis]